MKKYLLILLSIVSITCSTNNKKKMGSTSNAEKPFIWEGANIYFLLTDRFYNGDVSNDLNFNRTQATAKLRGFEGGDIKGITQKIKEGYFNNLGINAIWLTPVVEQIHGSVDEGTGVLLLIMDIGQKTGQLWIQILELKRS